MIIEILLCCQYYQFSPQKLSEFKSDSTCQSAIMRAQRNLAVLIKRNYLVMKASCRQRQNRFAGFI
ncbi:hypothetical protein KIN20_012362 [Parelaphostrongylus tenuis]|uniref:Uncharacterized protein n=1 Tax=Parelaphostrongylus tenuis TaxID=148309 RepID=A0AAD5QLP3_PARTN|nr:hypothetical protein KIN20_012362 [Parelaphostrongylus tenuis]